MDLMVSERNSYHKDPSANEEAEEDMYLTLVGKKLRATNSAPDQV
jgi:hypothetical protein